MSPLIGHILFEKAQNQVFYKNVKTNEIYSKDIANINLIKYLGKVYNLEKAYKIMYKDNDFTKSFNNPTSSFK